MITATLRRTGSGEKPDHRLRRCTALALVVLLAAHLSPAQDVQVSIVPGLRAAAAQATDPGAQPPSSTQTPNATVLLPPGTTLPLGLLRPLSIRSSSARGSSIYLQVTFPVTDGKRTLIPPGSYIQATIEKARKNSSNNPDLEFELSHASLIFLTGYTIPVAGNVQLVHRNAWLTPPASPVDRQDQAPAAVAERGGRAVPAMSAVGLTPPDLPPLPKPSLGNGPRNIMIAMGVIMGVGLVTAGAVVIHHRKDIYLETGTPLEIVLSAPLLMDADQVGRCSNIRPGVLQPRPRSWSRPNRERCVTTRAPLVRRTP